MMYYLHGGIPAPFDLDLCSIISYGRLSCCVARSDSQRSDNHRSIIASFGDSQYSSALPVQTDLPGRPPPNSCESRPLITINQKYAGADQILYLFGATQSYTHQHAHDGSLYGPKGGSISTILCPSFFSRLSSAFRSFFLPPSFSALRIRLRYQAADAADAAEESRSTRR